MAFGRMGARGGYGSLGSSGGASIPAAPPNTLRAARGSFTLTGVDMTPAVDSRLPAAVGSFIETGVAANLILDRPMPAAAGSFALTGIAATLTKATPSAGPVKTHLGHGVAFTNVGVTNYTVNIGTASADRLIVVGLTSTGTAAPSYCKVNGVSLTQDAIRGPAQGVSLAAIYSGLVTAGSGSQTISVDFVSTGFDNKAIEVWSITGLSSNTVKASASAASGGGAGGQILSVASGDLVFCSQFSSATSNFSPSTQVPDNTYDNPADNQIAGDWTIATTNASFLIQHTSGFSSGVAASYR